MTGYTIGPDVTMQLAYDEELIRVGHQILAPAFPPATRCRSSARQYTAVR